MTTTAARVHPPGPGSPSGEYLPSVFLGALTGLALVVRLYAAHVVGFGDSEALYAAYALYPQPAYLDHPGLVGLLARTLGGGLAPSPFAAHLCTSILATLAPWAVFLVCQILGAARRPSSVAAVFVAVVPEIAVGLFGMTPDLPLFFAWMAVLALFGRALLARPDSTPAAALFLASGVTLGVACASKVSGVTLGVAALLTLREPLARPHARTTWPWAAFALATLIAAPSIAFEARTGWPMLRHRLVDTQQDAGLSLRNLAAVILGQAAYVSPLLFVCGVALGHELVATKHRPVVVSLLRNAVIAPLVLLGVLSLWSRVAEPHWLAPAWLPLPVYYALRAARAPAAGIDSSTRDRILEPERRPRGLLGPRAVVAGIVVAFAASAFVYAWVLVPRLVAGIPAAAYDPRLDIANELYGWPDLASDVRDLVIRERTPFQRPDDVIVVGPVWTVCAHLRAALPPNIAVGCVGADVADFASWNPERRWARAERVIFVYDNRAPADSSALFPDRARVETKTRTVTRGGHVARLFTIDVLSRRAASSREPPSGKGPLVDPGLDRFDDHGLATVGDLLPLRHGVPARLATVDEPAVDLEVKEALVGVVGDHAHETAVVDGFARDTRRVDVHEVRVSGIHARHVEVTKLLANPRPAVRGRSVAEDAVMFDDWAVDIRREAERSAGPGAGAGPAARVERRVRAGVDGRPRTAARAGTAARTCARVASRARARIVGSRIRAFGNSRGAGAAAPEGEAVGEEHGEEWENDAERERPGAADPARRLRVHRGSGGSLRTHRKTSNTRHDPRRVGRREAPERTCGGSADRTAQRSRRASDVTTRIRTDV